MRDITHFIDGAAFTGASGRFGDVFNPNTGEVQARVQFATDAEVDKARIEYLFEHNYDNGIGVTGVDKTLAALMNGQVQELYLTADLDQITYSRGDVRQVLADYAPGDQPTEDADPNEPELLIDELVKYAAQSSDGIRIIEDPHLLKTAGGVGAILRYQAKGVSQQ